MKDVSDWLDAGHTAAELEQLVETAPDWQPPATIIDFPTQSPMPPGGGTTGA